MLKQPIDKYIEISGSRLRFFDVGSGPTVVLGSGYLFNATMWQPQIEALSNRCRLIVPELWGHGGSGKLPAGSTAICDLARQHLELLDRLEIEQCALVGLSLGGMWGAELALMAPERVSALVLMGTSLAAEPAATRGGYLALVDAIEAAGAIPQPMRDAILPLFFSSTVKERQPELLEQFDAKLANWAPERLRDSIVPLGRMIFGRRDAMDDLAQLSVPALVMTGADDVARPPAEGRAMAERIGCSFVSIPDAGHIANLEAPAFVSRALTEFLSL